LPPDIEQVRAAALAAIAPIRPTDGSTKAEKDFLFSARRAEASSGLPPYYLLYFLLVDLLGFRNLGQYEKIAWSVPIDFQGEAFLIDHRKFGVGVFVHDLPRQEHEAQRIVGLLRRGVRTAQAFFDVLADQAMQESRLNVTNEGRELFARFEYFRVEHTRIAREAELRSEERHKEERTTAYGSMTIVHMPALELRRQARWLALATIDAFFSWTEHVFIHIAILRGEVTRGVAVAELADAEWQEKFKRALNLQDHETKTYFDQLIELRRQLRNFIAHGAFGKRGEAFSFHSGAGAVPLLLPHKAGQRRFSISDDLAFEDADALRLIDDFIVHLWSGERAPAYCYIQEGGLPLVLPFAEDGTYRAAMSSVEAMNKFLDYYIHRWDQSANMDW